IGCADKRIVCLLNGRFLHTPKIIQRITMNPRTTALVLIEYQNDFTTPGGKLHDAVKPVMESTHMLENTVEMVNEARKSGATIVYVPITFADDFRKISPTLTGS